MLKTYRQVISDIINDLNALSIDDKFSYRFLYSKFIGRLESIIRQDSSDRGILNLSSIWYPIKKIEMVDYKKSNNNLNCDVYTDLMVSCDKLPKTFSGKNGDLIKILNINNSAEYKQTKSFLYKDIRNREFLNKKIKYFWIEEGYLFIPDSNVEEVRGYGMFKNSKEVDLINGDSDKCFKILDSLVLAPDYIIDISKRDVVNELRNVNKTIVKDENPDQNSINKP